MLYNAPKGDYTMDTESVGKKSTENKNNTKKRS